MGAAILSSVTVCATRTITILWQTLWIRRWSKNLKLGNRSCGASQLFGMTNGHTTKATNIQYVRCILRTASFPAWIPVSAFISNTRVSIIFSDDQDLLTKRTSSRFNHELQQLIGTENNKSSKRWPLTLTSPWPKSSFLEARQDGSVGKCTIFARRKVRLLCWWWAGYS